MLTISIPCIKKWIPSLSFTKMLAIISLASILLVSLVAFIALGQAGMQGSTFALWRQEWFWNILRFSILQACLSALLSVALALPIARHLALTPKVFGKAWFLRWCLVCFVMPSLILITGIVALFGRSGWLSPLLGEHWSLYGLPGILLAHVFLNMPFAIRVLTVQWHSIPENAWKMAYQLNLSAWQRWRWVEWPVVRAVLPALSGFIFLLCFNSFAVVLALGGGPAASTLEVAMYQALKYDFNPFEALGLAWTQLLIAGSLFGLFNRLGRFSWLAPPSHLSLQWMPKLSSIQCLTGNITYYLAWVFLTLPILVLIPWAFSAKFNHLLPGEITAVLLRSLFLAGIAACISVSIALILLLWWRWHRQSHLGTWISAIAMYPLVVPGMVLCVGVYIALMPWVNWQENGWIAIIGFNALLTLPFIFQQLRPELFIYQQSYQPLIQNLQLSNLTEWLQVLYPWLRPAIKRVWAISFVLCLGDVSVFAIFGSDAWQTLPWLIYSLAGSYRLAEAAALSLLLFVITLLILRIMDKQQVF